MSGYSRAPVRQHSHSKLMRPTCIRWLRPVSPTKAVPPAVLQGDGGPAAPVDLPRGRGANYLNVEGEPVRTLLDRLIRQIPPIAVGSPQRFRSLGSCGQD